MKWSLPKPFIVGRRVVTAAGPAVWPGRKRVFYIYAYMHVRDSDELQTPFGDSNEYNV